MWKDTYHKGHCMFEHYSDFVEKNYHGGFHNQAIFSTRPVTGQFGGHSPLTSGNSCDKHVFFVQSTIY